MVHDLRSAATAAIQSAGTVKIERRHWSQIFRENQIAIGEVERIRRSPMVGGDVADPRMGIAEGRHLSIRAAQDQALVFLKNEAVVAARDEHEVAEIGV